MKFDLQPRQFEAFMTPATELLYGGAVFGGKSYLMRVAAISWCVAIPGLQVYLFRRIREDLIKNHIEGPSGLRMMLAEEEKAGTVSMVEEEIRFWNGSKIYLCHCKDEKDRFKYLGAEIHVLLMDELTTFSEVIYRFLRSRVRAVGLEIPIEFQGRFPRILASSNPGNVGHQWVKTAFINNHAPGEIWRASPADGGMLRQFIPARLSDNPKGLKDDPTYVDRVSGLGSPALVQAMKDGDWNVVAGAYFSEFSVGRHVLAEQEWPSHWVRFRALDWGSYRPFSVGWYCIVGEDWEARTMEDRRLILPKGAMVRYREWYGSSGEPNVGLKLDSWQVAQGIKLRSGKERYHYDVADPAIFKHDDGPSTAERFATAPSGAIVFQPADNSRIVGWDQVRIRLRGQESMNVDGATPEQGAPMFFVTQNCSELIRTLPALQHDEFKVEDLDTDGEDHAADEIRYACMSRPWAISQVKKKPRGAKPTFKEFIDRGMKTMAARNRRI